MSSDRNIPMIQPVERSLVRNIVVFGETGAGKSSLINLIARQPIAPTSSDAIGCTFLHKKYELLVDDAPYAIWDTIAEEHLVQLLRDLSKTNGIHLLVYCIRASRLRKASFNNYNLFCSAICRKKVPVVAVVTGLERHESEMEDWWTTNEAEFTRLKMHFDGHACVTTLDANKANSPVLKQRRQASGEAVRSLIASTCLSDGWRASQEGWVPAALADIRAISKTRRRRNTTAPTPTVVLYDLPLNPTGSADNTSSFEGGRLMEVDEDPFLVYRIHDQHLRGGVRFKKQISSRGADLLIFVASVHGDPGEARQRATAFYRSYGGETRPLLVVVKDATSDERAYRWWNAIGNNGNDNLVDNEDRRRRPLNDTRNLQAIVLALPPPEDAEERRAAVAKLQRTIQTRSLQPVDDAPTGCFGWLTCRRRPPKLNTSPASNQEDSLTSSQVWTPLCARQS